METKQKAHKKQSGFIEICFGWTEVGSQDWLSVKKRVESMLEYFRALGGETEIETKGLQSGDIAVNFICPTPESEQLYYFWLKTDYLQDEYENEKDLYKLV